MPQGWQHNPSSWSQRLPLVVLAALGCGIARSLALYQLKVLPSVWEPFFGTGSSIIFTSGISRILPIPAAALGAIGYFPDAITGVLGGREHWRTIPWIVILFGLAVGPLGAVSILLVMLQPILFDTWCTLCLASAGISILMIGPAMDEVLASLQYLRQTHARGQARWDVFWGIDSAWHG